MGGIGGGGLGGGLGGIGGGDAVRARNFGWSQVGRCGLSPRSILVDAGLTDLDSIT
jgi:hypothetical protein